MVGMGAGGAMSLANHSSQSGSDQFQTEAVNTATGRIGPIDVGSYLRFLPTPGVPEGFWSNVADPDTARGIYPIVEATNPPTIDAYHVRDGDPVLALNGAEYQPATTVTRTQNYVSQSADQIRDRKDSEGQAYAQRVAFSSAQTASNPNVYLLTRELDLFFYSAVWSFYGNRLKRRTIGVDSTVGDTQDPTTYWTRDVPVYLVNANNGNELEIDANEQDWEQAVREYGAHLFDVRTVLRQYRTDVGAAYDAYLADPSEANRTALVSIDPATYAWPPFYDGPTNGTFRVL